MKRIMRRRVLIIMVAAMAALGLGISLAQAASWHAPSAPIWLQTLAAREAVNNGDASPTSAQWVLTTERAAAPLIGLTAATAADNAPEYVVVMSGHFVGKNAFTPSGASAPRGTYIAFTVDPASHGIRDFGIAPRPLDTSSVGEMRPLTLN